MVASPDAPDDNATARLVTTLERLPRGAVILRAAGDLDAESAPAFAHSAQRGVSLAAAALVIDLGGIAFIGVAGLVVLREVAAAADRAGLRCWLACCSHPVSRALQVSGLREEFRCSASVQTALDRSETG
ncbi:MAG: STAS domain-containing protein [Mycobacteriales bacterium]